MPGSWERLGAKVEGDLVCFRLFSRNATRIEFYLYDRCRGAQEMAVRTLQKGPGDVWSVTISFEEIRNSGVASNIYYGYRAWGPNWPYDPSWRKGSSAGFLADVDRYGNRFNPNKLLIDPYARELSHDPATRHSSIDPNEYDDIFYSGDGCRDLDSGPAAPKGIVLLQKERTPTGEKPARQIKDDIIYEVHLRGLTMADREIPESWRGTYQGAGEKASYFERLGITAVEFLPLFAFANEQNDRESEIGLGSNYWGYMTLNFFSPNRRYAFDKRAGGPTREFKEMVRKFHDRNIKVYLDIAINHTGEGLLKRFSDRDGRADDGRQDPDRASLLSFRGLDNATWYQLRSIPELDGDRGLVRYLDNSGCGPNLRVAEEAVRDFVIDVLQYWSQEMGVDGFRFDLATILGNGRNDGSFHFEPADPGNILNRAVVELPARDPESLEGVDLIAEPWMAQGNFCELRQLGRFPDGWSEWNDDFRDTFRKCENKVGIEDVKLSQVATSLAGSDGVMTGKKRAAPWHSINYLVSHDEYLLRDLCSYTKDLCWDHDGDPSKQRKGVRNGLAILMLSAGVPMIAGGDELYRTAGGSRNTVADDSESSYLDWRNIYREDAGQFQGDNPPDDVRCYRFAKKVIGFRRLHPALRPGRYFTGERSGETGLRDLAWYRPDGEEVERRYWDNCRNNFLGFRVDGKGGGESVSSIYVGYNKGAAGVEITLPENVAGNGWYRVCDTAEWMEPLGNWEEEGTRMEGKYYLHDRSVVIFVEHEIK